MVVAVGEVTREVMVVIREMVVAVGEVTREVMVVIREMVVAVGEMVTNNTGGGVMQCCYALSELISMARVLDPFWTVIHDKCHSRYRYTRLKQYI